jgi:ABC-type sugar transport system substrate-binding protein
MSRTFRIVVQIDNADPFWVQVREAVLQRAQHLGVDVVTLDGEDPYAFPVQEHLVRVEELLAQEVDAVVCLDWPENLAREALQLEIPIIQLVESDLRHPLFVSPLGLYDIAKEIGLFLARQLAGRGRVLAVGGLMYGQGEDGKSRVAGLTDALREYPAITLRHLPSLWTYESAHEQLCSEAWPEGERFDALCGLSDSLALAGRDAGHKLGLLDSRSLIVGINGDPLALAAILEGSLTATVQTSALDIAAQAMDLALQAGAFQIIGRSFDCGPPKTGGPPLMMRLCQKIEMHPSRPRRSGRCPPTSITSQASSPRRMCAKWRRRS